LGAFRVLGNGLLTACAVAGIVVSAGLPAMAEKGAKSATLAQSAAGLAENSRQSRFHNEVSEPEDAAEELDSELIGAQKTFVIGDSAITVGVLADGNGEMPEDSSELVADLLVGSAPKEDRKAVKAIVDELVTSEDLDFDAVTLDGVGTVPLQDIDSFDSATSQISVAAHSSFASGASPNAAPAALQKPECGYWHPSLDRFYASNRPYSKAPASLSRYVSIEFTFDAKHLKAFRCTGSHTFEPDIVTDNRDGKRYLGLSIKAWSTNMPNPYLDTKLSDSDDQPVYTVGQMSYATLVAGKQYSVTIQTGRGNATSDKAKIVWQRGKKLYPGPYDLSVFSDESKIVQPWKLKLPGAKVF